jgi:hypothetical protein
MLYSPPEKIKQYLSQYAITSVDHSKCSYNVRFNLRHLTTDKLYKLEIENPLYNVLSKVDSTAIRFNETDIDAQLDHLRTITFSDPTIRG